MKLLVIDGNSIINRAFYGIKALTTKDGRFTNAIFGFFNIFLKLNESIKPDAVAFAFDVKKPTFRHEMYSEYKGTRKGMPEELAQQLPVVKEIIKLMGYKVLEAPGWEADDILGTLANACRETGNECVISTGDRDSFQLIGGGVEVALAVTRTSNPLESLYNEEKIMLDYGVLPKQLIEIKALMGDTSDNIPGVAGIGEKTAQMLIKNFTTLDFIYENIETIDIKEKLRQKLIDSKEIAFLSRDLGRISLDAPVSKDINEYVQKDFNADELSKVLADLELFKISQRLGLNEVQNVKETPKISKEIKVENITDFSLFNDDNKIYFVVNFDNSNIKNILVFKNETVFVADDSADFNGFWELMKNPKIEKYTYNIKSVYGFAIKNNYEINNVKMDIMLASYVLNPSSNDYSIEKLSQEYSAQLVQGDDENLKWYSLIELCDKFEEKIKENSQEMLLHEIELPLAKVLADMETIGFKVDANGIKEFSEKISLRISEIQKDIFEEVGYEFNLNSPKQLAEALFVKLELPTGKKTKSGFSTSAEVLENLANEYPVVATILEYRQLAKLKSTYCDGLLKVIAEDGRIHSTFNQTETRTGRISSTEPNLQNIPVRQELGREMRKFFVADDDCVLADADYSQIELRVLADIADDKVMIDAFNNNDDIHKITASQVFDMPLELVTSQMRASAKAVNFGIVYGIGSFSLSKDIGVTRAKASEYIKGYLKHYSGVDEYMNKMILLAKEKGYSETLFNRRRYLPELNASNAITRKFGERVARNMPIQGTAADIIKIAMIKVYNRLKEENVDARLILQVHDELIVEAKQEHAQKASQILHEEMENACKMKVELSADVHTGANWYQAKG